VPRETIIALFFSGLAAALLVRLVSDMLKW